jgi:DNA-binding NarL/FixJ family response regulator
MARQIKVVIADDHPIFRHGLASVIESSGHVTVVGQAGDGKAALEIVEAEEPDIVILDLDMPVMDGVETARLMQGSGVEAKVVFLTMHKDRSVLRSMESLNVAGYVLKDSAMDEIDECITTVLAGEVYLSPVLSELNLDNTESASDSETLRKISGLTKSEKKILALITESKTNKEIADELFVSVRTIETHRYNICSKLDLNGAHALFKFAIKNKKKIVDRVSR